jgi:hypothetical protein
MQQFYERFHKVIGIIMAASNLITGHTCEHGSGPPCVVTGLLMILGRLMYTPLVTYVVTGIEFLTLENRGAVNA